MADAVAHYVRIPTECRVSKAENTSLLAPITEDDILVAVRGLSRRKAGGEDGLNNDFYADYADVIAPKLAQTCNSLLQGAPPPASFLKAVVGPLRKKGDSSNALDYRPILLLQSSYKIFAKILATRLQSFLGKLIGDTQQGFVHGRQMDRSVAMMLAVLETVYRDQQGLPGDTPGILLLDFAKEYDTVDRVYQFEVLRHFGFDLRFVDLM
ncbi:reverse transcriptase [Phytophthora megakarya]|uniref:Reverse transcriptase n=1 Tax=Phytophthora megakarya TaxID=4795 RepID=A0A225WF39_9STRA|nr:reverse transcriptase [Phytophthora megakarya]